MKIRIPNISRKTWIVLDITFVVLILLTVGFFVFHAEKASIETPKIPDAVSGQLLFTPYVPSKLPSGFSIDPGSYKLQETALLFTASNKDGGRLVFSEQSVPKDLSMDQFYGSMIATPQRVDDAPQRTIFGKLQNGTGTMASIITQDNTWILVTMPKDAAKETAATIAQGLSRQ